MQTRKTWFGRFAAAAALGAPQALAAAGGAADAARGA